jgi:arylsulfatase A-like enzyme
MGSITETATSAPGNSSLRPNTKAPLAMTLKLNGYSTAQFGKCSDYTAHGSRFTGKINWVQLDLGKDDNDHFIDPEERLRIAMARQ